MVFENRFCPNCGSRKVEPDTRHTNVLGEMIFNPDKWYCRECDYTGLMPTEENLEDEEKKEGIEFDPQENKKIDTDAGKAYTKFYIILIVLGLIYAAVLVLK